jgi:hypothetical protein
MGGQHAADWQAAEERELQNFGNNEVFTLEQLPRGVVPVRSKWVYSLKTNQQGGLETFKARLVAKGFLQKRGVDFFEVFAPCAAPTTIRALLGVAAARDWELRHIDVTAAFLNGRLQEAIYMQPPPGFEGPPGTAWRLHRSVYGLRQASRTWHQTLANTLQADGFTVSRADPTLFMLRRDGGVVYLSVHVDDMLLTGPAGALLERAQAVVSGAFKSKVRREATCHLGMEITRDRAARTLVLSQTKYTNDILQRFGMADAKPASTPLDPSIPLRKGDGAPLPADNQYGAMVGALMFLAVWTRPDISFAVGALARYMSAPTSVHLLAAKHVLRYLRGTPGLGITFGGGQGGSPLSVRGFSDADWAGNLDNRRSTSGYVFMLNGGAISWRSRLEQTVALSTVEAEYTSSAAAIKEALWLKQLMPELGVTCMAIPIGVDSQGAIQVLKQEIISPRTKHIDIKHHFARECVCRGDVAIEFVGTREQPADFLTKALGKAPFVSCRERVGVRAHT